MRTSAFKLISDGRRPYFVFIHTVEPPRDDEWREYVAAVDQALSKASELLPILIMSDGGAPNGPQRKLIAEVAARSAHGGVAHLFTTSMVVRAAVNAFRMLSWSTAIAHPPAAFPEVCARCGLAPYAVFSDFVALQKGMPSVAILRKVEQVMTKETSAQP